MITGAENTKPAGLAGRDGQGLKDAHTISPKEGFRNSLSERGLGFTGPIVADGEIHRFHVIGDKPGSTNGWYLLHLDGIAAGAAGSWKTGERFTWHAAGNDALLSESERAAMEARIEAARLQREQERQQKHEAAATDAAGIWEQAKPAASDHPYLTAKGVRPHGTRQHGAALLIPGFNASGDLQTLQSIDGTGSKKFYPGGKAAGAYCLIGEPQAGQALYIAEGYATGATIHETTGGAAVAIAFNAGNLKAVAEALAELHPEARIVIACDNDAATEGNPGLSKGIEAARAIGAAYCLPTFTRGAGTDFNDLQAAEGREAVLRCLGREYDTAWPPLGKVDFAPLPPFPWDCLPPVLREHAAQVATCYQVPPEYPAMAALTVAGFAMGNRTFVTLKNGVSVRPNLYTFVVMASGERKSSAYRPLTAPLDAYGIEHAAAWEDLQREKRIHRAKVERLEKELSKPLDRDTEAEIRHELARLEEPHGTCRDFLAENATEEALQVKLADCGERAAVFSADSRDVLQVLTGIYSNNQNRETTFLKSFDGDSLRVHRMGRTLYLERPSISLLLCVQTDKLEALGANAGLWAGGFIPRLLFIVPDSLIGSRLWSEEGLNPATQARYNAAITARLDRYSDQTEDCHFPLDPEAKAAWIEYYNALEEDMAGELAEHAPLAARWQTLPVRLAAILAEYNDRHGISIDDMQAAIELSGYLIEHARRAAGIMGKGLSSGLQRAVSHIREKGLRRFRPNDLRAAMRATAEETEERLADLGRLGYIRATGETEGHKHAPVFESNPAIWE
jgi:putative DNA primase/helicase